MSVCLQVFLAVHSPRDQHSTVTVFSCLLSAPRPNAPPLSIISLFNIRPKLYLTENNLSCNKHSAINLKFRLESGMFIQQLQICHKHFFVKYLKPVSPIAYFTEIPCIKPDICTYALIICIVNTFNVLEW